MDYESGEEDWREVECVMRVRGEVDREVKVKLPQDAAERMERGGEVGNEQ